MDKLSYCGSFLATPLSLEGVAGRKRRLFRAQRTGYGTKIGTKRSCVSSTHVCSVGLVLLSLPFQLHCLATTKILHRLF